MAFETKMNEADLGLTTTQAMERLRKYGFNDLPDKNKRNLFNIAIETVQEPMFLLLIIAGIIYLFLGELKEGISLFFFVNLIILIKIYQEGKTERALEALRNLASPRALVIRDGVLKYISGHEVVVDDVIMLKEGDRVPADGFLISASNLQVDESLLTGESLPVMKKVFQEKIEKSPPKDNIYFVYSGTLVVTGQGMFQVKATGKNTEMGRIGAALESIKVESSPLQKQILSLVRLLLVIGIVFCGLLIFVDGMMHGNWLKSTLLGIALLMSMIPEEFLVVMTIFPALGAWRLSLRKVLVRKIAAIETLGSTSVLCVDKTGTITQNRMAVSQLWAHHSFYKVNLKTKEAPPDHYCTLIDYAILASAVHSFDPMERAFYELGEHYFRNTLKARKDWRIIREYPISPDLPAMTNVWETQRKEIIIAMKGAPEVVMALCQIEEETKLHLSVILEQMACEGLRVLAVAKGAVLEEALPESQSEVHFNFLGLLALADPLREEIPQAVKECHHAGIKVIMMTGDYATTAKAIGEQAGLCVKEVLTGDVLRQLSAQTLQEKIENTNICARITPSQKHEIVLALKAKNEIVAMTGDGVNDAPALKSAHVGIAMGNRGSDVAREASSIVLLDDNFASIVKAIRSGRRIFDNMKKSMSFILAVHVPIAGIALFPILLKLPPVFYPLHIALIELIIDPTCSIAFENEPEEKDIMQRPPRTLAAPIFDKKTICFALLQGVGILMIIFLTYIFALGVMPENNARALTFLSLVISNLILIYANRSLNHSIIKLLTIPNRMILLICLLTMLIMFAAIYLPFFAEILHFAPLSMSQLYLCLIGGLVTCLWIEILKTIFRRLKGRRIPS